MVEVVDEYGAHWDNVAEILAMTFRHSFDRNALYNQYQQLTGKATALVQRDHNAMYEKARLITPPHTLSTLLQPRHKTCTCSVATTTGQLGGMKSGPFGGMNSSISPWRDAEISEIDGF